MKRYLSGWHSLHITQRMFLRMFLGTFLNIYRRIKTYTQYTTIFNLQHHLEKVLKKSSEYCPKRGSKSPFDGPNQVSQIEQCVSIILHGNHWNDYIFTCVVLEYFDSVVAMTGCYCFSVR